MESKTSSPAPSRRRLLLWGGLATLTATFAGFLGRNRFSSPVVETPAADDPGPTTTMPEPEAITVDSAELAANAHPVYSPLLNSEFTIEFPDSPVLKMRLVEVTPVTKMTGPKGQFQCFSLFFESSPEVVSDGLIGRVSHPKLKPVNLFLSPVGRPKNGKFLLEAAFSERV